MSITEDSQSSQTSVTSYAESPPTSVQAKCYRSYSGTSLTTQRSSEDCHHARLGEYAACLWRQNAMTDVIVVVQDREFKCHRTVLACYSPYFKEVLLKPGSSNVHNLEIPCVTSEAFEILLNFMYTGEMNVTCQSLSDVYRAARRLSMQDALNKCCELLSITSNSIENAINLFVTSKKLGLLDPCVRAFKLMLHHFEVLVRTREFLNLEIDQITEFLKADIIGTSSEINVYIAALKWINANFLEREMYIEQVMSCVRFPLMTLPEILLCHHPPLLPAIVLDRNVHEMLLNATCYVAAKHLGQESLFSDLSCGARTYLLQRQPPLLWDFQNLYDPKLYPEYRKKQAAVKIQAAYRGYITRKKVNRNYRIQLAAAVTIQAAYRGFTVRKLLKATKKKKKPCFIPLNKNKVQWHRPYSVERYRPDDDCTTDQEFDVECTRSLQNVIYAIGAAELGRGYTYSNSILCYSPWVRVWKDIAVLPEPRSHIHAIVVDDILYCIGGCDPRQVSKGDSLPIRDCYQYHIPSREWKFMTPLQTSRVFHGLCLLNNFIYAVGGKDDKSRILESMEKYDPKTKKWSECASMDTPCMGMGVVTYDNTIWSVGGMTGHSNNLILIDVVLCYDSKSDRWEKKVKMPHPIALMSLVQCQGKLFSIGGAILESEDPPQLRSVADIYIYDVKNNAWRVGESLPHPRHSVIATTFGDDIFVLGGYSSQSNTWLKEVFYYDTILLKWRTRCFLPPSANGRIIAAIASDYNSNK